MLCPLVQSRVMLFYFGVLDFVICDFNFIFFKSLAFKVEAIYFSSKKILQGYRKKIPEVNGYESSSSRLPASPRNKNELPFCTDFSRTVHMPTCV